MDGGVCRWVGGGVATLVWRRGGRRCTAVNGDWMVVVVAALRVAQACPSADRRWRHREGERTAYSKSVKWAS